METDVTLNSYDLQTSNILTSELQESSIADIQTTQFELLLTDGVVITRVKHLGKEIMLSGKIIGTSRVDLVSRVDAFKQNVMNFTTVNLDITDNGVSTRRYKVVTGSVSIEWPTRATLFATWSLKLLAPSGVAQATSTTTESHLNKTTDPYDAVFTVTGTKAMRPVITVTVDSEGGSGTRGLTVKNNTTGRGITIYDDWIAGDVIEVDCVNRRTKVNGTVVEVTGSISYFFTWQSNTKIRGRDDE